ncbi:hypothetical protein GCM10011360_34970 [Primorskyibacter flagellatus]|uniref:Uncharacterized protein n=1 Tax=Primorskyibacter flagellatus TaxID=1387277 RepID=A0A917AEK2_9RHOB|nr:hypothetical protein GCM10011360_34970 [Primorskyibacter flagellatus]
MRGTLVVSCDPSPGHGQRHNFDVSNRKGRRDMRGVPLISGAAQTSKRSAFITLVQAATKSFTNFSPLSDWA